MVSTSQVSNLLEKTTWRYGKALRVVPQTVVGLVVSLVDEGEEERKRFLRTGFEVTLKRVCLVAQVGSRIESGQKDFVEGK